MDNIYKLTYNLTTNYYDAANHLSVQGTLDLLQNIAARHAYLLGAGRSHLEAKGLFWVIARNEIEFLAFPVTPIAVKVVTWPTKPTRFYFDRYYKVIDSATDEVICIARSRWVLVDILARKIVSNDIYKYPLESYHDEVLFTNDFPRLTPATRSVGTHTVRPSEIDENGHLNNSKYGNIIYDFLPLMSDEVIKRVVIYYNNEALSGDQITIMQTKKDTIFQISGLKNDIIIFNSEVELTKWVP